MEEIMQDTMFEVPSLDDVDKVIVTNKSALKKEKPVIVNKAKEQIS